MHAELLFPITYRRMTPKRDDIIDMSKLSQRELLILLSQKVDTIIQDRNQEKENLVEMEVRIAKLETRTVVKSAIYGGIAIMITVIIDFLHLFK